MDAKTKEALDLCDTKRTFQHAPRDSITISVAEYDLIRAHIAALAAERDALQQEVARLHDIAKRLHSRLTMAYVLAEQWEQRGDTLTRLKAGELRNAIDPDAAIDQARQDHPPTET